MKLLKQLAGQTAIYGISSIAGRLLNYLLVPLHTAIFSPGDYGIVTDLYAYVAFCNIVYSFGMETTFFRFSTKIPRASVFHQATSLIIVTSLIFSALLILNASDIAEWLGYSGRGNIITWLAIILFIDAVVAIPFAKLRLDNKATRFAIARISAIAVTVMLNIFFLIIFRNIYEGSYLVELKPLVQNIYNPNFGIEYIFLANLMGNALYFILLYPEFFRLKFKLERQLILPMLVYALPLFIMGIAGMVNEQIDKILFTHLLPDNFYSNRTSLEALGIYGASFKLSVFMLLGIQAFRYAGEPFFFSNAPRKDSPELFARVMHYFILAGLVIFLTVSVHLNLIADIFLLQPAYHEALFVVPVLLFAKLLFGVYINLSIWFKLTDKTIYGTYITGIGAIVTLFGNILLVPLLGYLGAASAALLCYFTMCLIAYFWGKVHYPIPYRFAPLIKYLVLSVILVIISFQWDFHSRAVHHILNTAIILLFILFIYLVERQNFSYKT